MVCLSSQTTGPPTILIFVHRLAGKWQKPSHSELHSRNLTSIWVPESQEGQTIPLINRWNTPRYAVMCQQTQGRRTDLRSKQCRIYEEEIHKNFIYKETPQGTFNLPNYFIDISKNKTKTKKTTHTRHSHSLVPPATAPTHSKCCIEMLICI